MFLKLMLIIILSTKLSYSVSIKESVYKDIVIEIKDYISDKKCNEILNSLEVSNIYLYRKNIFN